MTVVPEPHPQPIDTGAAAPQPGPLSRTDARTHPGVSIAAEPPQFTLDLPHATALGRDDFLVGPANREAIDLIDRWPDWPAPSILLFGPTGSGKSHLVSVWCERAGAMTVQASDLRDALVAELAAAPAIAIEDIDRLGDDPAARDECERVAFHVINLAREQGRSVLMTSRHPAGAIDHTLPDLKSRVRAMPVAALYPPDDALLSGLLVKLFNDRQLKVEPTLITYLMRHMDRTMAAAHALVAAIDTLALASKRPVTRALAAEVLARADDAV